MARIVKPLTATQVHNAKPKDKPYKIFDGGGPYLQVSPNGGKHWKLKYMQSSGKESILSFGEFYPKAKLQRCVVHFYRNVLHAVPKGKSKDVALMLKAIHAQEDKATALQKACEVVKKLQSMKLEKAARVVESGCDETLSYYDFPSTHWRNIRTNNPLERLNREIRGRTKVIGSFPDGQSALMLVGGKTAVYGGQEMGN